MRNHRKTVLVAEHPTLLAVSDALLRARTVLMEQFKRLDNQAHRVARADKRARLLTTAPGVGPIVALTYASAIDDPGLMRFTGRWSAAAPHIGGGTVLPSR
jgi:transposase